MKAINFYLIKFFCFVLISNLGCINRPTKKENTIYNKSLVTLVGQYRKKGDFYSLDSIKGKRVLHIKMQKNTPFQDDFGFKKDTTLDILLIEYKIDSFYLYVDLEVNNGGVLDKLSVKNNSNIQYYFNRHYQKVHENEYLFIKRRFKEKMHLISDPYGPTERDDAGCFSIMILFDNLQNCNWFVNYSNDKDFILERYNLR